jgi:hypothetical protein
MDRIEEEYLTVDPTNIQLIKGEKRKWIIPLFCTSVYLWIAWLVYFRSDGFIQGMFPFSTFPACFLFQLIADRISNLMVVGDPQTYTQQQWDLLQRITVSVYRSEAQCGSFFSAGFTCISPTNKIAKTHTTLPVDYPSELN